MRRRVLHERIFRACARCRQRTFGRCEDCARPTCADCATIALVRLGGTTRLHRMCARCRLEYSSQDLLGATAGLWTALWRRIAAAEGRGP